MPHDPEQLALDLEDANARLEKLKRLIAARDEAAALVLRLEGELRQAKRKLKEAGWKLNLAIAVEGKR